MKSLVMSLVLVISSYSIAAVLPLQAQQGVEGLDTDLVLVDAQGMSLYIFTPDKPDLSTCSGGCLKAWPAVILTPEEVEKIKSSKTFGVMTRTDGQSQLTHDRRPLYYYVGDSVAGDRTGQGVGGVWFLLKAGFSVMSETTTQP